MSARAYASAFAHDIEAYLEFKAALGMANETREWILWDFDRWCVASGASELDRETVEAYVLERKAKTSPTSPSWMSTIRELGRWARANGNPSAYVLSSDFGASAPRVTPYLLSQEEIDAFFAAARDYSPPSPWAWQSVPFFALMHSCGLRTCEARSLGVRDVDIEGRAINVVRSKGRRSRRLPITDGLASLLSECSEASDSRVGAGREAFFVTWRGTPVNRGAPAQAFRRIWELAGLPVAEGPAKPRPYSFRHHFAFSNIERWRREGVDPEAMLPYLSRYMGHGKPESTYYYIHASPDFLGEYAELVLPVDRVLPEVGFDV